MAPPRILGLVDPHEDQGRIDRCHRFVEDRIDRSGRHRSVEQPDLDRITPTPRVAVDLGSVVQRE